MVNSLIDKIYVINLDRRCDRWKYISEHLTSLNMKYERISATELKIESDISSVKLGQISCFHSHIKTLRKAYELNLNSVLILEDDCKFIRSIDSNILNFISTSNYQILYLGCNRKIYKNNNSLIYLSNVKKVTDSIYEVEECGTTHAILYSKQMISKIIEFYPTDDVFFKKAFDSDEQFYVFDNFLSRFTLNNSIKKYCVYPILCTQIDSYSDIQFCNTSYCAEIENSWL